MRKEERDEIEAWRHVRVELLRDGRGVYGVGTVGLTGTDAEYFNYQLPLRPDTLDGTERPYGQTAYHAIPDLPLFRKITERSLITNLVWAMQARAGFPHRQHHPNCSWWSDDPEQQLANRRSYWGRKRMAWAIVNALINEAIETAAPSEAIKATRRFALRARPAIYKAAARSRYALQLTDTFPVLALLFLVLVRTSNEVLDPRLSSSCTLTRLKATFNPLRYLSLLLPKGSTPMFTWIPF